MAARFLTLDEVAEELAVTKTQVYAMVRDGETFPWNELFIAPPGAERRERPDKNKKKKKQSEQR